MNSAGAYAIGTLLVWLGAVLVARGIYQILQRKMALVGLIAGGVALVAGSMLLPKGKTQIPLLWPVMPFVLWAGLGCILYGMGQLLAAALDPNGRVRGERYRSGTLAFGGAVLLGLLFRATPDATVALLEGGIPLSLSGLVGLGALAMAAILAMVWAQASLERHRILKRVATHVTLLAGSVVFGIPFLWLLLTSFKQERDMASPDGIVLVPHVDVTVPFRNPKQPLYETLHDGETVEVNVLETSGDRVTVDIQKPMGLRGQTFEADKSGLKEIPTQAAVVTAVMEGKPIRGIVVEDMEDGHRLVQATSPPELKGKEAVFSPSDVQPVTRIGLRWANYTEALDFLPPEADRGLVYLRNTLVIVVLNVIGTILASAIVAYAFARLRFPGKNGLFAVLLATMMLPGAVTLLPQFLIFRGLGWTDSLLPLWVPAFFGSAFNIFLLRQFFLNVPMELEDAAKIDGCGYLKSFWAVMLPQVKPALAVIAIWTFLGSWNSFMAPLIYVNSPEHMPISYAVQMYSSDRSGEPGLLMAFVTMSILPVLLLFFFAQRYFVEGVTLSGIGGR